MLRDIELGDGRHRWQLVEHDGAHLLGDRQLDAMLGGQLQRAGDGRNPSATPASRSPASGHGTPDAMSSP